MSSKGHRKLLINGEELSELREGPGFRGIWNRCLRYVLHYRAYSRTLSEQDAADIVSEALQEVMSSILNQELSAEEVSIPLARALNRASARVARRTFAEAPDLAMRETQIIVPPSDNEHPLDAVMPESEEFIRQVLEERERNAQLPWGEDPLFKNVPVYDGPVPPDFSERHDDYLYGDGD